MAETLKMVADPNLLLFVMDGDREVAVIGTLLDLNEKFLRKSQHLRQLRHRAAAAVFFSARRASRARASCSSASRPEYRKQGIDAMVLFATRNYLL
jgi:hypothetical protein